MYAATLRRAVRLFTISFSFFISNSLAAQNNALNFDGTDDFVELGSVQDFTNADFTIEAWVRTTSNSASSFFAISDGDGTYESGEKYLGMSSNGSVLFMANGNGVVYSSLGFEVNDGDWHHVALTMDYTAMGSSAPAAVYIDGINATISATLVANVSDLGTLKIGQSPGSGSSTGEFSGDLDEVRIWSEVRTELEIRTNMTKSLSGSEANLVAYYNFDEGTAASNNTGISAPEIQDQTSNNNDGTLNNFAKTGSSSNWVDGSGNDVGATFITTWQTTTTSETVQLPTGSGTYNYTINWGDGSIETLTAGDPSHVYATAGTYAISIDGTFPHFQLNNNSTYRNKLQTIEQWGAIAWSSMQNAFQGAANLTYNATDVPDLSGVTNMNGTFASASLFNGNIGNWNVSTITNMSSTFSGATTFNQDLSSWDVTLVQQMGNMFENATAFNNGGAALTWGSKTGNVQNMEHMFANATNFNADISGWDVSSVTTMSIMFSGASAFNQNISSWNVSSVTDMTTMFNEANSFNQDISNWNVSSVDFMNTMFLNNTAFNNGGVALDWGSNMSGVFAIPNMFEGATAFNQDVSSWDVSNVISMASTFLNASSFNQNLANWDISNVTNMTDMLSNSAMNTTNYDNTLIGWATLGAGESQIPSSITLGATNLTYCTAGNERNTLDVTFSWTINGDATFNQEINVQGNNNDIADGSTSISTTIDTDFGFGNKAIVYTLQNTGTTTLNISSIASSGTNSSEFVVSSVPSTVAASGSETFTVTFTPLGPGTKTATITINSDDCDEAAYDFAIQGSGAAPGGIANDLQLWLKAGEEFTVSQWNDQSGNTNHASQGTASAQPSSTANAINFNTAIDFDGSDYLTLTNNAGTMGLNNSDYELFFIANTSATDVRFLISAVTQERYEMHLNGDAGHRFIPADATNFSDIGSAGDFADGIARIFGGTLQSSGASAASHVNGLFTTDIETVGLQTAETGAITIGRRESNDSFHWLGQMGEVIVYGDAMTSSERQQVFSYLALKYGITLDQTSATDYLAADGATVWNATTNATYNNDIAGLARDDASELDQRQSGSINTGAIIEIANGTHASPTAYSTDDSWLIWGNDGGATTFGTDNINNSNATTSNRMSRVWRASETGTVGSIEIRFSNALATGTVSLVAHTSNATFPADGNRRVVEMTDDGTHYSASIDLADGEYFSFANANYATLTSQFVVINEVITDPQQDWGASSFFNPSPGGTGDADDEWIELYITTDNLDMSSWTIEMNDGTDESGSLAAGGAFNQSNYRSLTGGLLNKTKSGDYLILGDPSSGMMNSTGGLTVVLKDGTGGIIDQVTIATGSGTGFSGSASSTTDESVARIPNGSDTDVDATDFVKTRATLGETSAPSGTVVINEIVTDPFTDWNTSSFDGSIGAGDNDANDEWIELYIGTSGLNLTGWTIEMNDGTDVSGSIASGGVFATVNYVSVNSGSFIDTQAGDYLILGNPTGEINNTSLTIILRDASNNIVDQVTIGGGSGEAPSGSNSAFNSEAVVRYPNATDTGADDADFVQTRPTLGTTNSPVGTVVINEVVTDPQQDWSANGFDGTIGGNTVSGTDTDEWVELYIASSDINLTGWTISLEDGSGDIVDQSLAASGAFSTSNYISSGSGSFVNTVAGDFLVLGNPTGSGTVQMNNDVQITLKDASANIIDQVKLGGSSGEAPSGSATGISDEAIARIPNGTDTDNNASDFSAGPATIGAINQTAQLPGLGNSLVFDGSDDFVNLTKVFLLSGLTYSAWVKTTSTDATAGYDGNSALSVIGEVSNDIWNSFGIHGGLVRYRHFTGTWNGVESTTSVNDGNWHHIAISHSQSTGEALLYVDGKLEGSSTLTYGGGGGSAKVGFNRIAGSFGTTTTTADFFDGEIDEVRIWSIVRTQEQIIEDMNNLVDPTSSGLEVYYRFDQSSGTSLSDLTTNNRDGTLNNMAGTEWTAAGWDLFAQNQSILQSGGSDISTGTSGELTLTDVSFLNDDNDIILAGHDNGSFSEVAADLPSSTLLTARYDRIWNLRKNDASGTSNGSIRLSFNIGSTPNETCNYYLLERTGTSGDFAIVPGLGVNPNGNSIEFVVDASAIDNGSYYTLGRSDAGVGNALDFDASDDQILIGNIDAFNLSDADFTLEAWIYPESSGGSILSKGNGGLVSNSGIFHFYLSSNRITLELGRVSMFQETQFSNANVTLNTWNHIAAVFDQSAMTVAFYINGIAEGTGSYAGPLLTTSTHPVYISRQGEFNDGFHFNGSMDEIRVWDDARTQQELLDNMFKNLSGEEANLVAYYRFNQGVGDNNTSLPDLSPNGYGGTLTNFNNLGSATSSSNYITSTRTTIATSVIISNGGDLTATDGELTLISTQNAGDFLQDANDYIRWNNDGGAFTETTSDVPSGTVITNRYTKTWQLDKNDAVGTANGNVTFTFDLGTVPDPDYTYYLLTRSGTSGDFSIVEALSSSPTGNNLSFVIDGGAITDNNYFTLGRTDAGAGNALDFDGTDDLVVVLDDASIQPSAAMTIEGWIYPTSSSAMTIFSKYDGVSFGGTDDGAIYITTSDGMGGGQSLQFAIFDSSDNSTEVQAGTGVLALNEWQHLAGVFDNGTLRLYLNGILLGEANFTESTIPDSSFDWGIGEDGTQTNATASYFDGQIDEVRIWLEARTEQQIRDNMNRKPDVVNESNLVGYYPLNKGISGGTNTGVDIATDYSGNSNSGTLNDFGLSSTSSNWVASTATVADQTLATSLQGAGNALDFDGANDFVSIPDNNSLDASNTLTLEAWIRLDNVTGSKSIISKYFTSNDANTSYILFVDGGQLRMGVNQSDQTSAFITATSPTLSAGNWYHIAGVANGSDLLLYVDGILAATSTYDGTILNSTRQVLIGKTRIEDSDGITDGQIDEVRIWNTARTASEIQTNMFESLNGSETGLVAYYTFDESTGTTLDDNSANTNTGTLNNMDDTDWVDASAREPFKTNGPGNLNSGGTWVGGATPGASQTLYVQHDLTVDADLTVDDFNLTSGNTLTLGAGQILTVTGNIVNNGTIIGDGKIQFTSGSPMISGGTFSNLEMNGGSPILCGNTTMTGTLTLTSGNLQLEGFDLTLSSGATVSGGSSSSYIQTINQNSSGGSVSMEIGSTNGVVTYPLGTNTNYTPIFFTNLGSTATFAIRTFDGIYPFNTAGVAFTQNVISKTWDVNAMGSGFNVTLSIQWNSADELTGFDRTNMYVSTNDGSGWTERAGPLSATEVTSGVYQATASGITSFSGVGGGGDVITPVTLLDFYAQQIEEGIELIWHTATEIDNEKFIIERSENGLDFNSIDEVPGNGDSDHIIEYRFVDAKPLAGANYYRLKQVDYDGDFEYSPIVLAMAEIKTHEWLVYPNPFSDRLYIGLKKADVSASIKLTSMNGQVILNETVVSDNRFVQFDNLQAPTGLYILEIQQGDEMVRMRIVSE